MIAAIAEKSSLTVPAVDKDSYLIAEITGQPIHILAERDPKRYIP